MMSALIAWLLIAGIVPVGAFYFQPTLTKEICKDLRFLRILHYVALTLLGVVLYFDKESIHLLFSTAYPLKLVLFVVALVYAAIFAIISNNFEDLETDKISNTSRPLVQNTVNKDLYWKAGLFCQVFAFILSGVVQMEMFISIALISLGYYVYSCRPFRLKKIPFLAKLLIGFNSLVVAVAGFVLVGGKAADFPMIWIFYILVPLSLSANFVDLKDIEGDRAMNVRTLPVLWGAQKARFFIAFMTFVAYLIPCVLLQIWWVYPLTLFMLASHIYFLYAQPYHEKPVFLVYVSSIFGLNMFLFTGKYF